MQDSLSSLTFKGSIPEAIAEAKKQRKLFVVYISGENVDSSHLQQSTWTNIKVAESVSKYCILLHIPRGSADATHFSTIYPTKSIPCITAVGYNGVQLWQNEGFVSADVLASSLEKGWLSLHIQQTATALSAALSSRTREMHTSGDCNAALCNQESSSGTLVPLPSLEIQSPEPGKEVTSEMKEDGKVHECAVASDMRPCKLFDASKSDIVGAEQSTSYGGAVKEVTNHNTMSHMENSRTVITSAEATNPDNHIGVVSGGSKPSDIEANTCAQNEKYDIVDDMVDAIENHVRVNKLSDALLNIRLPNGVSLQAKFPVTSTLRIVKDYVDGNEAGGVGSYDLAIPYPRKVFNNQDLSKSLLELGLSDRQALILVPHQKPDCNKGITVSEQTNYRTDDSAGGYFSHVRRILSYFNPFSYLGGGTNTSIAQESQIGMWEYSPNPALENNLRGASRPYSLSQQSHNNNTDIRDGGRNRKPITSSPFGSNIHTLKHDEDDTQFRDRNDFWNGNSTQYGGDSGDK